MKSLLFVILLLKFSVSFCQSKTAKEQVANYILTFYKSDSLNKHTVDTIILLPNGHYFALSKKELVNGSGAESGSFDCYEIAIVNNEFQIKNSVFNISNNTGGEGICEIQYRLYYLDKVNYLIVVLKSVSHMGQYCPMYVILNSSNKIIETNIINDPSGYLEQPSFDQVITVQKKGKYFKSLAFKSTITTGLQQLKITESKYIISNFNNELNCFTNFQMASKSTKIIILP